MSEGPAPAAAPRERSPVPEEPLTLPAAVVSAIRRHAAQTYPDECCGALIGRSRGVTEAFPLPNTTPEGGRRRFLVRPDDYRAAERRADGLQAELIGFYHSHPDHPDRPSQYDLDHAWPSFSYVIVSVRSGQPAGISSWRLRADRAAFEAEALRMDLDSDGRPEEPGLRFVDSGNT